MVYPSHHFPFGCSFNKGFTDEEVPETVHDRVLESDLADGGGIALAQSCNHTRLESFVNLIRIEDAAFLGADDTTVRTAPQVPKNYAHLLHDL